MPVLDCIAALEKCWSLKKLNNFWKFIKNGIINSTETSYGMSSHFCGGIFSCKIATRHIAFKTVELNFVSEGKLKYPGVNSKLFGNNIQKLRMRQEIGCAEDLRKI